MLKEEKAKNDSGQSLIETAIMLPVLICIACNAMNIAYFWFVALTLTSAPRIGAEYASQGGQAEQYTSAPTNSSISDLVYENLLHTLNGSTSNVSVRVCAVGSGIDTTTTTIPKCNSYGPTPASAFPTNTADPESSKFYCDRVDVAYTVTPLVPGGVFNVALPSNMTFYRHASMRHIW